MRTTGGKNVLIGIIDVGGLRLRPCGFSRRGRRHAFRPHLGPGRNAPSTAGRFLVRAADRAQAHGRGDRPRRKGMARADPRAAVEHGHGSHGTHVASIAAGNRGVCRNAFLAGVLIDLPRGTSTAAAPSTTRRASRMPSSTSSSSEKSCARAPARRLPVSINISLGTNGHAHDGSSAVSRWLDARAHVPRAARSRWRRQRRAGARRDPGRLRLHHGPHPHRRPVAAAGLANDIELVVIGNGPIDVSENEIEIWYSPADRFAVSVPRPTATGSGRCAGAVHREPSARRQDW